MRQYSTFHFSSYSWNHHAGKITLKYSLDNEIFFEETILLPEPVSDERLKEKEWEIERLLFALHLIGGVSYYKTCLPKTMKIESGGLSRAQAKFWNLVYEKGLGEFFYKNDIDFRGLVNFPADLVEEEKPPAIRKKIVVKPISRILVPIGGGKDSMVTVELLRKLSANLTLLRLEPHPLIDELSHVAGLPMLTVRRTLSPPLFELNKEGALNGHVPITAYLSILSALLAVLYDFDAVAMSNEKSANIGNIEYKGQFVNHQWSKSAEFERSFRKYLENAGIAVEYFSALRPYSELKIAELFSKLPQYFEHTTSCNKNWKILKSDERLAMSDEHEMNVSDSKLKAQSSKPSRWCGKCPKCAFVFAILAAFLDRAALVSVFGSNFFENKALLPLFRELLGLENFKPFECVGTPEETKAAFVLAHRRGDLKGTTAMTMFEKEVLPGIKNPDTLIAEALKPDTEHFIPKSLVPFILPASR